MKRGLRPEGIWAFSSVGQSGRLITGWSGVQVPEGPPMRLRVSINIELAIRCRTIEYVCQMFGPNRVNIKRSSLAYLSYTEWAQRL